MVNLTVEHQGVNAEVVANLLPGFQGAVAVDANVIPIHQDGIPHITATFPLEHQGQEYAPHIDMTIGLHLNGNADNHGQVHNLMVQDIYINGIPYTSGMKILNVYLHPHRDYLHWRTRRSQDHALIRWFHNLRDRVKQPLRYSKIVISLGLAHVSSLEALCALAAMETLRCAIKERGVLSYPKSAPHQNYRGLRTNFLFLEGSPQIEFIVNITNKGFHRQNRNSIISTGSALYDQAMDNEEEIEGSDLNDQAMNNVPEIEGK
ncbi:hypothetical protein J6590_069131 [Homalodisca vitripennis]|nr:hypothetical protein J6590_069131 [Homalodisca vitripennis]